MNQRWKGGTAILTIKAIVIRFVFERKSFLLLSNILKRTKAEEILWIIKYFKFPLFLILIFSFEFILITEINAMVLISIILQMIIQEILFTDKILDTKIRNVGIK